jgi:hypothetical protein
MRLFKKEIIRRDDGTPYLIRWFIIYRSWFGQIMLHKILLTDNDCPHDHPWSFTSIMLKGTYIEHEHRGFTSFWHLVRSRKITAPAIMFRPASWAHTLEIPGKPVWTLVFTGRKSRSWGFWTKKGWLHHSKYKSTNSCE